MGRGTVFSVTPCLTVTSGLIVTLRCTDPCFPEVLSLTAVTSLLDSVFLFGFRNENAEPLPNVGGRTDPKPKVPADPAADPELEGADLVSPRFRIVVVWAGFDLLQSGHVSLKSET